VERIGVVGVSYRTTDVDRLAAAALPPETGAGELAELARLAGFSEMVYLATCNRVELYFRAHTHNNDSAILFHLRRSIADLTGGASQLPSDDELYLLRGMEAARHLFRVTAALDSMMVGEAQIAGQVKQAHERAHEAGILGGLLDQTFHESFHLAKRVRNETELTLRPVSLVTLVQRKMESHLAATSSAVLILGAGEMAGQCLRMVRGIDAERHVLVANRTPERAEELVEADPMAWMLPLDTIRLEAPAAGMILAATSSEEPVLGAAQVERIRDLLPEDEPMLIVDLAMPPNVEGGTRGIRGVEVVGIEEMREEAEANRQRRLKEMELCEELVDHQLLILRRRVLDRSLSPVARNLHRSFDDLANRTVEQAMSHDLAHLPPEDRETVERMTRTLIKRLVQVPLRGLKGAAWDHSAAVLDSFLRGLEGVKAGPGESS